MATQATKEKERASKPRIALMVFGLLIAIAGSAALVVHHHTATTLPGCGPSSGCAALAKSVWGTVPGIDLPTSHAGLAWFIAMLIGVLAARGMPRAFRALAWLGGIVSIVLAGVMIKEGTWCPYCALSHLGNIIFIIAASASKAVSPATKRFGVAFIGSGLIALATLFGLSVKHQKQLDADAARDLEASTGEIVTGSRTDDGSDVVVVDDGEQFTGRYRSGPEEAPIRVVIWSDYQCQDCRRIDGELLPLLESRGDISFSVKHYPFCVDCNDKAKRNNYNPHPNACWAARAAEAAGILEGDEGFFRMHEWLFERRGGFTDAELNAGLAELGFDRDIFIQTMMSDETLQRVRADIAEADTLGIHYTPFIFINGTELRGWTLRNAVPRAIDTLTAENLPARTAAADRPVTAIEKYVNDWSEAPRWRGLQLAAGPYGAPASSARVRFQVWGDLREPNTRRLDAVIRAFVDENPDAAYWFRSYPFDSSCNSKIKTTKFPLGCRASRLREAARIVAGDGAAWAMHGWLASGPRTLTDTDVLAACAELGMDGAAVLAAMDDPAVVAAIESDIEIGARFRFNSIPHLVVNEHHLPRWELNGQSVIPRIAELARQLNEPIE